MTGTQWVVASGVPSGSLVGTQAGALVSVLGVGLLSLLLGAALALTVARRATVPLRQLAQGGPQAVEAPVVVSEIAALRSALAELRRSVR